jgi:hypothetical protein
VLLGAACESLCAVQFIGMGVMRYVLRLELLGHCEREQNSGNDRTHCQTLLGQRPRLIPTVGLTAVNAHPASVTAQSSQATGISIPISRPVPHHY